MGPLMYIEYKVPPVSASEEETESSAPNNSISTDAESETGTTRHMSYI